MNEPDGTGAAERPARRPLRDELAHPVYAILTLACFVAFVLLILLAGGSGNGTTRAATWEPLTHLCFAALLIVAAVWFIACVVGDARRKTTDMFVFAYAFTFGAFALLVTPFILHAPPEVVPTREGALKLVHGCVVASADEQPSVVSRVTLCPKWAASAASAASQPQFPLMVAIGGVAAKPLYGAPPPARWVEIHGGLTVPLFVIVLAFIGGAVSLSRRIPEYQRRHHPQYVATEREWRMEAFQVRESVVFQIMQLVSAPFLAVATWYIVTPATLATAATLAFGTGFASEPLLLMIRGIVEGIRPDSSRRTPSEGLEVRGTVQGPDGQPVGGATVTLTRSDKGETSSLQTGTDGRFAFTGLVLAAWFLKALTQDGREVSVPELTPSGDGPLEVLLKVAAAADDAGSAA